MGAEGKVLRPSKAGSQKASVLSVSNHGDLERVMATQFGSEYLFCSYLIRWKSTFEI